MMGKNNCLNCSEYRNCRDSFASWIFFIVGIIATIAVRAVTVLTHWDAIYAKLSWYLGIIGFFSFFVYKYKVGQARAKSITQRNLVHKIKNEKKLSRDDYALIGAILCALSSKKERINYLLIFIFSALALGLAVYMDFIR